MLLRENLKNTKMMDGKNVPLYLTRVSQVHDEIISISDNLPKSELVRTSLKSLSKEWKPFIKGIVARDKFPNWNRLWDGFIQEELWDEDFHKKIFYGENVVLISKMKGKAKKDLSKVKCFTCGENGHYAIKCLHQKKGDNEKKKEMVMVATSTVEKDDFTRR